VPTILVSPYVPRGTVFRAPAGATYDFDHTSFIATILGWAGVDAGSAGLGQRVVVAPTFDGVLTDTPILDTPTFTVPADYASQGGGLGPHHLPFGHAGISIDEFRKAGDESADVDEFESRLAALAARPTST
jgi:hypothetical protein